MNRTEKEKMLAGEPYRPNAPEIEADQAATAEWLARYNAAAAALPAIRHALLAGRLAPVGEGARPSARHFVATTASISTSAPARS